ncbi:hypothetical protein [Amycolatopsis sp. H20-H5]|uniref:hypothetical protein n=1 Tax=Amycolatopsis sp. H20-H5 TaxID=3046309 RepID=UPI002DBCC2E0|nr:hypothetical protein [Amycolatopsis sp. H20-H5]MEC3981577.1 hypothetical protein [Amycolatopsis sp. H20-H5]
MSGVLGKRGAATVLAIGSMLVAQVETPGEVTPAPTSSTSPSSSSPSPTAQPPDRYPFVATSPQSVLPGERLLVSVGCRADQVHDVRSMALDLGPFETSFDGPPPIQAAVATVHQGARPGFYPLEAFCDKARVTINFEVRAPGPSSVVKPPSTHAAPSSSRTVTGHQVSKVPVGAPQTGGGATAY